MEMMWFMLAFEFKTPVAELKSRMTYREFLRWQWYMAHRPVGERAMDGRIIDFMAMYANAHLEKGKAKVDFTYFVERDPEHVSREIQQTPEEAAALLKAWAAGARE